MTELRIITPCPLPSRGNWRVHWTVRDEVVDVQKRAVDAAVRGRCSSCGRAWVSVNIGRKGAPVWRAHPPCSCRAPGLPQRLPAGGPPWDVLLVRVASNELDDDNLGTCLKGPRDAVAELLGAKDDRVPWIRWPRRQRKHQPSDPPRWKLPPGQRRRKPEDPVEQLELVIAPRQDVMAPAPAVAVRWDREHDRGAPQAHRRAAATRGYPDSPGNENAS